MSCATTMSETSAAEGWSDQMEVLETPGRERDAGRTVVSCEGREGVQGSGWEKRGFVGSMSGEAALDG